MPPKERGEGGEVWCGAHSLVVVVDVFDEHVLVHVRREAAEVFHGELLLRLEAQHPGGEDPPEPEPVSLPVVKAGSLVVQRVLKFHHHKYYRESPPARPIVAVWLARWMLGRYSRRIG